jgi:hypothetical protein
VSKSIGSVIPDFFTKKDHYSSAKAKWGIDGEIVTYAKPAIDYTDYIVDFKTGSCKPGSHAPQWP